MRSSAAIAALILLAGCAGRGPKDLPPPEPTKPVVVTVTKVVYVPIKESLTDHGELPAKPVTWGDAKEGFDVCSAELALCHSQLDEIGRIQGTEADGE